MAALKDDRQEKFVALVAITSESGEDAARAYSLCGYRPKSFHVARSMALRLLKKPEVQQRLVELRNIPAAGARAEEKFVEVMTDIAAEKKWVLSSLKTVAKRCMRAEPVLDSMGQPTGEYTFHASGANRALELLGKEYGLFVDKTDSILRLESIKDLKDLVSLIPESQLDAVFANTRAQLTARSVN